jgi:hypothetical protein
VPALACTTEVSSSYHSPRLHLCSQTTQTIAHVLCQVNNIVTVPALACTTETIARVLCQLFFLARSPTLVASTVVHYHTINPKVCNTCLLYLSHSDSYCLVPLLFPYPYCPCLSTYLVYLVSASTRQVESPVNTGSSTSHYLSCVVLGRLCLIAFTHQIVRLSTCQSEILRHIFFSVFSFALHYFGRL